MNQHNPESEFQPSQQTLAERNALRFAQHHTQPISKTKNPLPTGVASGSTGREHLKHAVNLIGLCQTMCPSDELETRSNESDIQALEVPLPGQMHPLNWTIQDTAIKRFRRSAADYKLDVPEWVRPPEVLERTLAYLEEWIMERDRQGPDPRFPQKDAPPPPLDVYQFIWDRTRMIRKDFILQNYVGTGGRCDAKAVRCHERIARWHAMCEHQLSHIDDFVNMQSQQNMQELGQTMKTLNSFYDDALDRSTKEVPDDKTGREKYDPVTSDVSNAESDKNKVSRGGCLFDTVQGPNPIDYNGQPLNNEPDNQKISKRLIGDNNNKSTTRGTAEPEMRGMYMLLTMENEGGMEVLKYAAKLFKERPAVYHSPAVQLALRIFKAIKDMNYVKFFSILRSSSTPYLYSCIMFKHVEVMRRIAIKIMSISYGARNKSTGEGTYDQYPLERLVHILCFEDLEEARKACEFYNITIKKYTSQRTGEVRCAILWKGSRFRIPKDTEKGHTLRLKPCKMMRTIESKLNGATRLAVCRGEASWNTDSLLDNVQPSKLNPKAVSFSPQTKIPVSTKPTDATDFEVKAKELIMKKKLEARIVQQAKEEKEKERQAAERRKTLKKQLEEEHRKKELLKKQQLDELEKRRRKEIQEEKIRQHLIEKDRLKRLKEEELIQKAIAEKERNDAEEAARKEREKEEHRKREEKEKRRLERERLIVQKKLEKKRKEQEKRRMEEDERRREALRLKLEVQRKREAEEKRKAADWQRKTDNATKVLLWYRWKRILSRPLEISIRSRRRLAEIDPSYRIATCDLNNVTKTILLQSRKKMQLPSNQLPTSNSIIEQLLQLKSVGKASKLAIADMVYNEIESVMHDSLSYIRPQRSMHLIKIALICPESKDVTDQGYASLLYHWVGSHVKFGKIEIAKSCSSSNFLSPHEVRTMVVRGSSYAICSTCDVALFVIPPQWSKQVEKLKRLNVIASSLLHEDIPRVALVLNDYIENDRMQANDEVIAKELGGSMECTAIIHPSELSMEAYDSALKFAFRRVGKLVTRESCVSVIRIPAIQVATEAILDVLRQCIPSVLGSVDEDTIVECSRLSLRSLIEELHKHSKENKVEWSLWPAPEFCSKEGIVESYFTENEDLPIQWAKCLDRDFLQETYQPLLAIFRGHFRDAYQRIVLDAPITVQDDCASECAQGQYRRCLEKALMWLREFSASSRCFLYLPEGMLEMVLKDVVAKVERHLLPLKHAGSMNDIPFLAAENDTTNEFSNLRKIAYDGFLEGHLADNRDSFDTTTIATTSPTATLLRDNSSFLIMKRSNSFNDPERAFKKRRQADDNIHNEMNEILIAEEITREDRHCTSSASKPSQSNCMKRNVMISASQAYTNKLERLLHGDDTIELSIGNTSLSRYLRDVREPQVLKPKNTQNLSKDNII